MSIKESALSTIQTITDLDFIRAVTSIGASRKVLASDLGKYMLETYAGSELNGEEQTVQSVVASIFDAIDSQESALEEKVKKSMITDSASGEIASFSDGSDLFPALSCIVDIDPIQDLNGYDAPWVGGAGKNKLLNTATSQTVNGVTVTVDANGVITLNGTATASANIVINQTSVLADGTYIISGANDGQSGARYYLYSTRGLVGGQNVALTYDSGQTLYLFLHIESGAVMTASNDKIYPMIRLASVSDATFAPYENICPISGHDEVGVSVVGKNWLDISNGNGVVMRGVTPMYDNDGGLTFSGQLTEVGYAGRWDFDSITLPAGTYTFSLPNNAPCNVILLNDWSDSFTIAKGQKSTTRTFDTDRTFNRITISDSAWSVGDNLNFSIQKIQIESGSTATPYEPYNGNTYTIQLGQTVYGGTLDVDSGLLTVDRVKLSTTWGNFSKTSIGNFTRGSLWVGLDNIVYPQHDDKPQICNVVPLEVSFPSDTLHFYCNSSSALVFLPNDTADSTPIEIVYELATPQTYQLTPQQIQTLLGQNNVWSDAGEVAVTYYADPKLYIDGLIGTTEEDFTANAAIASGAVFGVGDKLYKATTTIAAGETIVPGTNCTETSLVEQINSLYALV